MTHTAPNIIALPAFNDNYIWLIQQGDHCAVVDPGDATPVLAYIQQHELTLTDVLITHHHWDHTDGLEELLSHNPKLNIIGLKSDRVPLINSPVNCGDRFSIESVSLALNVKLVPGHTIDHIVFYNHELIFSGDTLFSAGCGRLFEGSAEQMHSSLSFMANLNDSTQVYCGHEYTLANLRFAEFIEPDNGSIQRHINEVEILRKQNKPSLPSTIGREKNINPFLRSHLPEVIAQTQQHGKSKKIVSDNVFATLRLLKDSF